MTTIPKLYSVRQRDFAIPDHFSLLPFLSIHNTTYHLLPVPLVLPPTFYFYFIMQLFSQQL